MPQSHVAGAGLTPRPTSGLQIVHGAFSRSDAVLARIIPSGSLEQIIYRVDALHWLEDRGVRVMNSPRAIERIRGQVLHDALLHDAGLLDA